MHKSKRFDKNIITVTVSLIICVFALSLVNPAISKKPDKTIKELPNDEATSGDIHIETYWDNRCTERISSIDWGSLNPGTNKTVTLFLKNKGRTSVALSYYSSNWQPSEIANYLSLTWDYTGQSIEFKEVVQIIFTLYVSENAETIETFSFDIDIICTE
jgi:hypothetical protein